MTRRLALGLVLLGTGCPWIGEGKLDDVRDLDGDGSMACAFVEAGEACDCDDADPTVGAIEPTPWFADADGDGFGDGGSMVEQCTAPAGYVDNADDCDDGTDEVGPGQLWTFFYDGDRDGVGGDESLTACIPPLGYVSEGGDCNDIDPAIRPGAAERCNGIDDNCDDVLDDADALIDPLDLTTCWPDGDGDGYGDPGGSTVERCSCAGGGEAENPDDCDDGDRDINPGTAWYLDEDGDGVGSVELVSQCQAPDHPASPVPGDCDDGDGDIYPGADDAPWDGVDQDCSDGTDLDVDGDAVPDWLPDPAVGEPFDPTATALAGRCDGAVVHVTKGGDTLQQELDGGQPGTVYHLVAHPTSAAANLYDPVVIEQSACIVADAGVSIASTEPGSRAITFTDGAGYLLVEGVRLEAEVGLDLALGSDVLLSRVHFEECDTAFTSPPSTVSGLDVRLLHSLVEDGGTVTEMQGRLLLRQLTIDDQAALAPLIEVTGELDVVGLQVTDVSASGGVIVGDGTVRVVDMTVEQLFGAVVNVDQLGNLDVTLEHLRIRDVVSPNAPISVTSKGGGPSVVKLHDVQLSAEVLLAGSAGVELLVPDAGPPVEVIDTVVLADGTAALALLAPHSTLHRLALGATAHALGINHAPDAADLTLVAATCVTRLPPAVTEVVAPTGRPYARCTNDDSVLNFGGAGTVFTEAQGQTDLLRYHPTLSPVLWDLRPHPRSYEKIGDWTPGFGGAELLDDGSGLAYGAYVGGALIADLHDVRPAGGDGVFDSYLTELGLDPDDVTLDADGDGRSAEEEFGTYQPFGTLYPPDQPQGSHPLVPDTDDDDTLDGDDTFPLDASAQ